MDIANLVAEIYVDILKGVAVKAEPLIGEQKAFADFVAKSANGILPTGLNAYIWYEGTCNSFGQNAILNNALTNKDVRVTVRIDWSVGIDKGSYDVQYNLPAGSRMNIGCTYYEGSPPQRRSYQVVGTVP